MPRRRDWTPLAGAARRVFRLLLLAYPPAFRRRLGADLLQTHGDRAAEAWRRGGWRGVVAFWLSDAARMGRDGLAERLTVFRRTRSAARLRVDGAWQDLRYAVRALRKRPATSFGVIVTFALGIGANAAIFSVVDAVLLRALPYPDPSRLVRVWSADSAAGDMYLAATFEDFNALRAGQRAFSALAAFSVAPRDLQDAYGRPSTIAVTRISEDFFPALDVGPVLGRGVTGADFAGGTPVAMLSHGLWQTRYGGDPGVLGATIRLGDDAYTVIGVMGPGFDYPQGMDVWRPFAPGEREDDDRELRVFGRLAEGVTIAQAGTDVARAAAAVESEGGAVTAWVQPLHATLVRGVRTPLLVLMAAVALVLLIACANIAGLLLASGVARRHETAVRVALGAGRARLARQLLAESFLLAGLGGVVGIAVGTIGLDAILALSPSNAPRMPEVALDGRVVAVMVAVTVLVGVGAGLYPALHASRRAFADVARDAGRAGVSPSMHRAQRGLVVLEIALGAMLTANAALLMTSLARQIEIDRGFDPANLLAVQVDPVRDFESGAEVVPYFDDVVQRVRQLPGVVSVSLASTSPMETRGFRLPVAVGGAERASGSPRDHAVGKIVSERFFADLGVPVVAGRGFGPTDDADHDEVAIVNEAFVRRFLQDDARGPVGRRVDLSFLSPTVVGVVRDLTPDPAAPPEPTVYLAFAQIRTPGMTLVIRTADDADALLPAVREQVWSVDPTLSLDEAWTMRQAIADSVASPRFTAVLVASFAAIALGLAAAGVYGTMSYTVAQRAREMGLRQALGASRSAVRGEVMRTGMTLVAAGVAIGIAGALALSRVISSLLFGVHPADPAVFGEVVLLLATVASVACYLPARRATAADPVEALRE